MKSLRLLPHARVLAFYQEAMDNGEIIVSPETGRNIVIYEDWVGKVARIVYSLFNPLVNLTGRMVVHHIDFQRLNDHPDNLMAVTHSEHIRIHMLPRVQQLPAEVIKEIRAIWSHKCAINSSISEDPKVYRNIAVELNKRGMRGVRGCVVKQVILYRTEIAA